MSSWVKDLIHDLIYGWRMLWKSPGFTAISVLTLAVGIGANMAIFSIVSAVFLQPLPFPNADRICVIDRVGNRFGGSRISIPIFLAWEQSQSSFEHFAAFGWRSDATLTGFADPERVRTARASTDFFHVLGVQTALGRDFLPAEGQVGGQNVVIVTDQFWHTHFGRSLITQASTISLDGEPYTIIGVLPQGFKMPIPGIQDAEIWFPMQLPATSQDASNGAMIAIGLLNSGVHASEAAAALTPSLNELRTQFPTMFVQGEKVRVILLRQFLQEWAGTAPLMLFSAVGLVLLIACANVANLSLARFTSRQQEIAIRAALGARRLRIVQQFLTESILLALMSGLTGIFVCYSTFRFILTLVPQDAQMPHIGEYRIDLSAFIFAILLSFLTGIIFGSLPALETTHVDLNKSLRESGRSVTSGQQGRIRQGLAIAEITISVVLLVAAALMLHSFASLENVPLGFETKNLTVVDFSLPSQLYNTPEKQALFVNEATRQLATIPGIDSAAVVNTLPLSGGSDRLLSIEGQVEQDGSSRSPSAEYRVISPNYFRTLGVRLERGRTFYDTDQPKSQPVVIINHAMAHIYWPRGDAIGNHVWIGKPMGPKYTEPSPREIIGIVSDVHETTLFEAPPPTLYVPLMQESGIKAGYFLLRSQKTGAISSPIVRSTLLRIDNEYPAGEAKSIDQIIAASLTDWRFRAILLTGFGSVALFIAIIGVYGVISYWVAERTHEIGIRVALGAKPIDVINLVVVKGVALAAIGTICGLLAAVCLSSLIKGILYGVSPMDPLIYSGVTALMIVSTLLATYVPARRAMRANPIVALRSE